MINVQPAKKGWRIRHLKPKFEAYTNNAQRVHEILDELVATPLINTSFGSFPLPEQIKGKMYCKFHNVWTHNTASCLKLKDQIQEWIDQGRIQFEIATNATIVVIEFSREKKNKRKHILELLTSSHEEEEEPVQKKAKPIPEATSVVYLI